MQVTTKTRKQNSQEVLRFSKLVLLTATHFILAALIA